MTVIYLLIDMCDKKISKDYILSIIMIIFAMLLSGHVLTSPNVSLFVVLILLNFITYKENKKKKILFTAFDLGVGGIEKCLTNLVNKLDNKKYDIDILLQIHNGIFIDNVNNNVNISDYKLSKSKNKIVKLISNLFKFIKLMILNYDKYDYSFCYATGYVPSAIMGLIGSNNNAIWIHTNVVEYMKYYEPYKNKNWDNSKKVKKFLNRIFARFYKKKIFVSYDGMESYLKINPKDKNKCLVIYNIIDYDDIIKKSNEKIEDIKLNSDEKILLNVGRHTEYDKKLSRIFSAIEKLKNENYKFKFVFVGDGPMHDEYVKMTKDKNIQDYVIFTGIKKNPYPYYKIADAIVLSSSFEGFPTIYLESIILDKVIITTDVSDARSVVENKYGIVVENNDDSIYNGIKKYLDEGFSVKDKFDVNKYNNTSIQLLESVINNEI